MLKKIFKNQRGMGIAITIMSLVLIAILGTALVIRGMTLASVITKKNYSITAVESAKAGVSCAIYMVEQNSDCNTSISPTVLTNYTVTDQDVKGYYEVQINNNINGTTSVSSISNAIDSIPPGKVEIVSIGYCGYVNSTTYKSKTRAVAIGSAIFTNSNPFTGSLFLNGSLTSSGNAGGPKVFTDSYDSSLAGKNYTDGYRGHKGDVGSNCIDPNGNPITDFSIGNRNIHGRINIPDYSTISGNGSYYDPNGNLQDLGNGGAISPLVLSDSKSMTPMTLPTSGAALTNRSSYSGSPLPSGDYRNYNSGIFSNVILQAGGTYIIKKITGNVMLAGATGQKTTIYVVGDSGGTGISLGGSERINAVGRGQNFYPDHPATDLFIYGTSTCTSLNIGPGNCNICAAVYAPNAHLSTGGNPVMWGALTVGSCGINGSPPTMYYDEALGKLSGTTIFSGLDNSNITWAWSYGY
ncbi:MAG: hypothetical protein ABRQ37_16675 [Candidatus Eremiobacterota bacterium]